MGGGEGGHDTWGVAAGGTYVTHEPLKHHQLGLETLNLLVHLLLDGFRLLRCLRGTEIGEWSGGLGGLPDAGADRPDTWV